MSHFTRPSYLRRIITRQRRTVHLPTIHLPVQTLARLALIRPPLPVHQHHVRQLLVPARQLPVALRTALVLLDAGQGAVAPRLLARHHAPVARAAPARLAGRREGAAVGHLGAVEHAAELAGGGGDGAAAFEAAVRVDARGARVARV